jgi:hypothetical protein
MKKNILLIATLLVALSAATAFAAATTMAYGTALPTGLPGKLSTNVFLAYKSEANNTGYTAGTSHNKGTKSFASSSGDAAIFSAEGTNIAIPDAPDGTASASFTAGTWTAL